MRQTELILFKRLGTEEIDWQVLEKKKKNSDTAKGELQHSKGTLYSKQKSIRVDMFCLIIHISFVYFLLIYSYFIWFIRNDESLYMLKQVQLFTCKLRELFNFTGTNQNANKLRVQIYDVQWMQHVAPDIKKMEYARDFD